MNNQSSPNIGQFAQVNYPSPQFRPYMAPVQPPTFYPPSSILVKQAPGPDVKPYDNSR
jgi:hypothetical protein